jgi:hypothetical protein
MVLEFAAGSEWEHFDHKCKYSGDSRLIAWYDRNTSSTYCLMSNRNHMNAGVGPSLDNITKCTQRPVFTSTQNSTPESFANDQWLQSVRVFANGTVAGLVHNEFHGAREGKRLQYCSRVGAPKVVSAADGPCKAYLVQGAGSLDANGCYATRDDRRDGWEKDSTHVLYSSRNGIWRLANPGKNLTYVAKHSSHAPPNVSTAWECGGAAKSEGACPPPTISFTRPPTPPTPVPVPTPPTPVPVPVPDCQINSGGLAISANGGELFNLAGHPPHHLVAALPEKYSFDIPSAGFDEFSSMLRGADGAFYGAVRVKDYCNMTNSSHCASDRLEGNCFFRTDDLMNPGAFRARDEMGNFTVRWTNPYDPTQSGEDEGGRKDADPDSGVRLAPGVCATHPISNESTFGSHITFRKIVPPSTAQSPGASTGNLSVPTFIALSATDAKSALKSYIKYAFSYEQDFGKAMRGHGEWAPSVASV